MKKRLFPTLILSLILQSAWGENWPQWRGPDANGVAPSVSTTGRIAWSAKLPGRGSSTPIVWENNIIFTSGVDGKDTVLCFDSSGTEVWRTSLGPEREGRHRNASGSNPSPVTDGTSVFAYFKSGTVAALDLKGAVRWSLNLQTKYGEDTLWWDLGSSPALAGSNVVIPVMQAGTCYVIGLDKATGKVNWKVDRTFDCPEESDQAYTTPIVRGESGKERVLVWGSDHVTAHEAATGETLWTCGGFNPEGKRMWRAIASAVAGQDILLVPYGRGKFLAGVRLGGEGDVTATHTIWNRSNVSTEVPTPIVHGDRAYILSDRGTLSCLNVQSGETKWESQLPKGSGKFFASPLLAGDHVYCVREDGILFINKIHANGFELVGEVTLDDRVIASPVPFQGRLLVRGEKTLMCID